MEKLIFLQFSIVSQYLMENRIVKKNCMEILLCYNEISCEKYRSFCGWALKNIVYTMKIYFNSF